MLGAWPPDRLPGGAAGSAPLLLLAVVQNCAEVGHQLRPLVVAQVSRLTLGPRARALGRCVLHAYTFVTGRVPEEGFEPPRLGSRRIRSSAAMPTLATPARKEEEPGEGFEPSRSWETSPMISRAAVPCCATPAFMSCL